MTQNKPEIQLVPVADIMIGNRSRSVQEADAQSLAKLLQTEPLMNPITLWRNKGVITLAAGAHRLAAFKLNGETHIPAIFSDVENEVDAKQIEVLENLGRKELSAFDFAKHLSDWKAVYEAQHPETKHGAQGGRSGKKNEKSTIGFSRFAAERLEVSTSKIKGYISVWSALCLDAKEELDGSKFVDRFSELEALSRETETIQKKVLKMLFPRDPNQQAVGNIPEAIAILKNGRSLSYVEKKFQALNKHLSSMSDKELDTVLTAHEERILAWAKKQLKK